MTSRSRILAPIVLLAAAALIAGCSTGPSTSDGDPSSNGQGPNCEGVTTGGFELFVDPRLTVSPSVAVAPLTKAGEKIEFVDAEYTDSIGYSYEFAYVSKGQAFTQSGRPFYDTEGSPGFDEGNGRFWIEGPLATIGADGGPYAGILGIWATDSTSTKIIANICVMLAKGD